MAILESAARSELALLAELAAPFAVAITASTDCVIEPAFWST